MKLIFNEEEVKEVLLEKAKSMGINVNAVVFSATYGNLQSVELSFDPKLKKAGNDEESSDTD